MTQIGTFTPDQARLLWQDYLQRKKPATKYVPQDVGQHRVFVKNTESEVIPPYACLEITGTEEVGGRTAITVRKPTTTTGEYLFNSQYSIPVAVEAAEEVAAVAGVGWAYRYGVVVMQGDGSTEDGQYQPVIDSWEIEPGDGPFVIFGEHSAADGALIGRVGAEPIGPAIAGNGPCKCVITTGVIPPTTAAFGHKLAYRWTIAGLATELNKIEGFDLEADPVAVWNTDTPANVWVSDAIERTCYLGTDEYFLTILEDADLGLVASLSLADGETANCEDTIEWVWAVVAPGTAQPDRTNAIKFHSTGKKAEDSD